LLYSVCRELLLTGETWLLYTDRMEVQLLQSEQIIPFVSQIDAGLKLDEYGRMLAVNVARINEHGQIAQENAKPVSADNMVCAMVTEDPSSIRGMPPSQASFPMLLRLDDICDSEALAWQVLARLAVTVTREAGPTAAFSEAAVTNPDQGVDGTDYQITDLDYALMFQANPGESVHGIDRNIPGKDFPESVRMMLRLIGLPLGMPLEIILLDWTKSNYSQSRAVLEQAHESFEDWQSLIAEQILTPLYQRKLSEWLATGLLPTTGATADHTWIMPPFPWLDPEKEAKAQAALIDLGIDTYSSALMRRGSGLAQTTTRNIEDVVNAIDAAAAVKERTGEVVPWQYFAGRSLPTGALLSDKNEQAQAQTEEAQNEE